MLTNHYLPIDPKRIGVKRKPYYRRRDSEPPLGTSNKEVHRVSMSQLQHQTPNMCSQESKNAVEVRRGRKQMRIAFSLYKKSAKCHAINENIQGGKCFSTNQPSTRKPRENAKVHHIEMMCSFAKTTRTKRFVSISVSR